MFPRVIGFTGTPIVYDTDEDDKNFSINGYTPMQKIT